ncbi:MAG: efflux RND transporter periplasmic adaptor subunit [Bacteroidales bacterium]|nr:efflux RND transporter periplasmic adaptor subunit [Bacteroidales bacterium]MDT8430590.1 efflux RND transporter periplasmic adaptor subunit [Bacteroidales bacterium]
MTHSNRNTIIIAAITLLTGLLAGWLIFGGGTKEPELQEHIHETELAAETTWTCSMHPQIRQQEPGDCPICGMDLIPLESEGNDALDPGAIRMSETAMKLADVVTAPVRKMKPVKNVRLNGKVQADERLVYSQSSHITGRIEQLMVNFTGEYIRKGQTIASVYSPELVTAQEELFEAEKIKDAQPELFQAARDKLRNWKLTDNQIDKILATGETREAFPVTADVSGYVTKKMVNLGDYITKGKTIYEIADLSRVWVMFEVYETDIAWISENDSVEFTVQSLPGKVFKGVISFIDPVIDSQTRVAKARVSMKNPDAQLKPGMFTSGIVEAQLDHTDQAMVVPKSAVMWTGTRSVVFVRQTTDQGVNFTYREVTLGPSLGDGYIIDEGLEPGEVIAVNGTFSIDAAAQLAGKPSMMSPEGGVKMTGHNHGGGADMAGQEDEGNTQMEMAVNTSKATISDVAKGELEPLYNSYLELTEALANDDFEQASTAGIALKDALGNVNMGAFKDNAHEIWMDHADNLENTLEHVAHHGSIEELRSAYKGISDAMIALTRSFGTPGDTLYLQYCPMANNDQGANWLSNYSEIKNPYFGEMMLKCGETHDTIQ